MINTLLGSKGEMSQNFVSGQKVPVTKIVAGPCVVTQIKSLEKDGYWAIQIGFGKKRTKNASKALQGHLRGAIKENLAPRFLVEIRTDEEPKVNVGDVISVSDIFKVGDVVNVSGTSKGKGFAGVVKRWHFEGGPRTHGQSDRERAPGSIGQTTTPGRVFKGKKMAGRMGGGRITVKNLHIVSVTPEKDEIEVSGAVPGVTGTPLSIKRVSSGKLEDLEKEQIAEVVEVEETEESKAEETKEEQK